MRDRYTIYVAKLFSMLFAPFYFPLLAFILLFTVSYMRILPLNYKLTVLVMIYGFTIAFPLIGIWLFRRMNGIHRHQLTKREMRTIPYLIFIMCYGGGMYVMAHLHMPHFMLSILLGALMVQLVCAFINNWMKISTHSAAAGAMVGAVLSFSLIFLFDPTWWMCVSLLLAGSVATSRLILRRHSLCEVNWGLLIGFICGFLCIFF